MFLDHVAISVQSVDAATTGLPDGIRVGETETFASEGTRELYVGREDSARILFIEPWGEEGPYHRAVAKRGYGLHHIAFNTPNILQTLDHLAGTGWYLHPSSVQTFLECKTVWLVCNGVPSLIEICENDASPNCEIDITLPADAKHLAVFGLNHGPLRVSMFGHEWLR